MNKKNNFSFWSRSRASLFASAVLFFGLPNIALAYITSYDEAKSECEKYAAESAKIFLHGYRVWWCVDEGVVPSGTLGAFAVYVKESANGPVLGVWWRFEYWATQGYLLDITPSLPIIPSWSGVENNRVLTQSELALELRKKQGGTPVAGATISLLSSRNSTDIFSNPVLPTDSNGRTKVVVSTRDQSGISVVTSPDTKTQTKQGSITWLPAKYDKTFLVTCYIIADESKVAALPISTNVCGLPEKNEYRTAFLKGVRINGSGMALDGTIIHHNDRTNCYNIDSCARTATGKCATVGTTIAVDPKVIPKRSTVNVDIIGRRVAQDTGNKVTGYHIDEYVGPQPELCTQLGHRYSGISFLKY